MTRVDLFSAVHKGIRAALFDATARAARTDFTDRGEAAAAADAARRLVGFLEEHGALEDAQVLPVLAGLAPELHEALQGDHARVAGLGREVVALAERLAAPSGAERMALGRRLHDRLGHLAAEHLVHMQREERDANRALWAHRTDEELRALHGRIVGSIPPERMAEWFGLVLPALSVPERAAILAPLRAAVPGAALRQLTGPAQALLGREAWARTAAAAGLEP